MNTMNTSPTRALTLKMVAERIGRSRASIYEMMDKNSPRFDAAFPAPFKIGVKTLFVEMEVEQYLQTKIAARRRAPLA
ncbi:helix-turn-helix transcriptional regulator [Paraburkholderia graminis]|uniref:Prophage regulatory protein n=1 Tax=Paraburkholderia graminis TaxID=60548 RepID=A0ABD5CB49_9BURK|nr:AlpA family phage regulatory protein [Paraburkholderia graminis]MDR6202497.1 prophage regulatory protein [Paraburkholderia graminis]